MPQGSRGTIEAWNDFTGALGDKTWIAGETDLGGGWGIVSNNEGTLNTVNDETGGVLQFLTDTGNNDDVAIIAGPFEPAKGTVSIEARFKIADDIELCSIFCGFTETLTLATPEFPATQTAAGVVTYVGAGGKVGLLHDGALTTNVWKAIAGDGTAASNTAVFPSNGTAATDAIVLDEYDIVRVNLYPSGYAEVWHDEELVVAGATGLTTTDRFYAILMCENRSAAAEEFEVDYVWAQGVRDWAV